MTCRHVVLAVVLCLLALRVEDLRVLVLTQRDSMPAAMSGLHHKKIEKHYVRGTVLALLDSAHIGHELVGSLADQC